MRKFVQKFKYVFKSFSPQLGKFNSTDSKATHVKTNLIYGGDLPNPIPNQSFGSVLFNRLIQTERRNDIFQINAITRDSMTVEDCLRKSVGLAKRFQEEGVQKGDFVILVGGNSLNMNIALIGTFFIGAIPLPLTSKTSLDEFRNIVKFLKPKYFGCDRKYLYFFKKALDDSSDFDVSKIFVLNNWEFSDKSDNFVGFTEFIKGRGEGFESFQPAEVDNPKDDLALLVKTNAETFDGKLIGITHFNMNSVVARLDALEKERNFKEEVILMVQKVMWFSGIYCLLFSCCHGSQLIVMDKFEEEKFLKAVEEFKVTTTYLYHPKCWQLLKFHCNFRRSMSSCKNLYSVDGSIPISLIDAFKEKFHTRPRSSYGFPELTGLILEEGFDSKIGSTGKLVPNCYAKVIKDDSSNAGPNEKGELCFKGPMLCKGYLNDEKGFKNIIDRDGFYLSGCYGYYDENEEFFIIDKIIYQIQYKDYKISPRELETIIKSLDSVKDVCVAGLQHETDGEYPIAFVTLQKDQNVTEQDIIKYVSEKVPTYKRIRGVVFLSKIPRFKDSGGINRKVFKKILLGFRVKTKPEGQEALSDKVQTGDKKKAEEKISP